MKIYRILSTSFYFLCASTLSFAQDYKPPVFTDEDRMQKIEDSYQKLDQLFEDYGKEHDLPSISYGLVVDGKLAHSASFGTINYEQNLKASPQSDYHIASMTKSFTAMAILKLRDQGKLSLDDPLEKYVPEAKNLNTLTTDSPKITIRDLLTHHAGFPEDNPWGDRQLGQPDQWLENLYSEGLSFSTPPETAYEYSNLGFSTLGLVIKKVSGKTYQEYIQEAIFKPLGMNDTYWEYSDVPEDQFAVGYRKENGEFVAQPLLHSGSFGAMGGLITSVEDFSKYMGLHLAAWPPRSDEDSGPVKRSSIREMHHPWNFATVLTNQKNEKEEDCFIIDSYGYGLHHYENCDGRVSVWHSGGLPGYGSRWRILTDYGFGFVVFANKTYAPTGPILDQAINKLIKWADLSPRTLPPSDILQKRKKDLLSVLPEWKNTSSEIFADNFFNDNFISDLQEKSQKAFDKIGTVQTVSAVVPENQLRGYFTIEGEKGNLKVWFSLSPEPSPKIQAFRIQEE